MYTTRLRGGVRNLSQDLSGYSESYGFENPQTKYEI